MLPGINDPLINWRGNHQRPFDVKPPGAAAPPRGDRPWYFSIPGSMMFPPIVNHWLSHDQEMLSKHSPPARWPDTHDIIAGFLVDAVPPGAAAPARGCGPWRSYLTGPFNQWFVIFESLPFNHIPASPVARHTIRARIRIGCQSRERPNLRDWTLIQSRGRPNLRGWTRPAPQRPESAGLELIQSRERPTLRDWS